MKQRTIHLSFGKKDIQLYNELMRQSTMKFIPVSALVRQYVRQSIDTDNRKTALNA